MAIRCLVTSYIQPHEERKIKGNIGVTSQSALSVVLRQKCSKEHCKVAVPFSIPGRAALESLVGLVVRRARLFNSAHIAFEFLVP
ncbi:hypothetical protein E2C01_006567 [Portunus trituberculatus]|uniref:Uncharacterized protein n=1 Tax=Portunus trituberculatus TaxID=210409 RepID=A0A5B7CWL9_PORTR|nr:hypothetical protein [Portunus trituberculatus]